jgi:hypothetical protein
MAVMSYRAFLGLAVTLGTTLPSAVAWANPGINGFSGKPNDFGVAETCSTNCHQPQAPAPTLDITMPTTVDAGSTHEVTIVVNGTRLRTALNAAFSDGVVVTAGQNTVVPFPDQDPEEVTSNPFSVGATGTFTFSFVAPSRNGTLTLWIAAMSASGAGSGGDGVTATTRTVTVTGGAEPPDGGTSSSGPEPDSDDGTAEPAADAGASSPSSDTSEGRSGRRATLSDEGGCAVSARGVGAPGDRALAPIVVGLAFALLARRRRYLR